MPFKKLLQAILISLVISLVGYAINLTNLFPQFLGFFCVSLVASYLSLILSSKGERKKPRAKKKKKPEPSNPINGGQKETGQVKWFSSSKGFGFITRESGEEIFVHFRSILGNGHRALREGQQVEYSVSEGSKGLQAEDVSPVK